MLDLTHLRLEDVRGVGTMELNLVPGKQAYVFIGTNGVGKTKLLEALFQTLLFTFDYQITLRKYTFATKSCSSGNESINFEEQFREPTLEDTRGTFSHDRGILTYTTPDFGYINGHKNPIVFVTTHQRGFVPDIQTMPNNKTNKLGTVDERKRKHLEFLLSSFIDKENISSQLPDVEQWFVKIAQNTNRFQKAEDKRDIEIDAVVNILHQIDKKIDPAFIRTDGDERVYLNIDNKERKLSQLSTGFVSLIKIIQTIISGYGYFTNTQDLQNVEGYVLIDEIESHLHLEWQVKIIPTLKKLFPKTTFFIATHSPLVLSQLEDGEAYELKRDADNVVRTHKIKHPGNTAMIDLLKDAFNIDLNDLALSRPISEAQHNAREKLLERLQNRKVAQ